MTNQGSTIRQATDEEKRLRKIRKEQDRKHYSTVAKRLGKKTFAVFSKQYGDNIVTK